GHEGDAHVRDDAVLLRALEALEGPPHLVAALDRKRLAVAGDRAAGPLAETRPEAAHASAWQALAGSEAEHLLRLVEEQYAGSRDVQLASHLVEHDAQRQVDVEGTDYRAVDL